MVGISTPRRTAQEALTPAHPTLDRRGVVAKQTVSVWLSTDHEETILALDGAVYRLQIWPGCSWGRHEGRAMHRFLPALLVALGLVGCATTTEPVRFAAAAAQDPLFASGPCQAAVADANQFSEQIGERAAKGFLLGLGGPFTMGKARQLDRRKAIERERHMEEIRAACYTQPAFERGPVGGPQRWPGGRDYLKLSGFQVAVGGRSVVGYAHPTQNTIWVRAGSQEEGEEWWSADDWVRTVAWEIELTGCRVAEDREAPRPFSWEISYACPAGVDLRALMIAQHAETWVGRRVQP